jgi:putative phosphoesterase
MYKLDARLIGIVSDTHDQVHHLARVIDFFNRKEVGLVLHCGDWVSPFTLVHYVRLKAPLYGVFGNNDGDKLRHLSYAERLGLEVLVEEQLLELETFGRRIAVYHGDSQGIVDALVGCGSYDVVLHGHTHEPGANTEGGVLSLNPGTLMDFTNQDVQGASIGMYDAATHRGKILPLAGI